MKRSKGDVVADRFRLERLLGEGGMGSVWSATHLVTEKVVALKFMHGSNPELVQRFVREARAASAVRHPNVVNVHDILPLPDGTPLMVLEMLDGEALAQRLEREGRLSPQDAAQIMVPVASAVAAAHAAGIVHRDLKPENIFLARYPGGSVIPKVLDFGIAKLAPSETSTSEAALTRTGAVLGTPYYMAPEQIFGEKDIDARADIWSLGVILYYAMSGTRPFDGDNFGQLFKSVTTGQMTPLAVLAPWIPAPLSSAVDRMLAVDRARRLSDLRELEHVLLACLGGPDAMPMPLGSVPRLSRHSLPGSSMGFLTPPPMSRSEASPAGRRRGGIALALSILALVGVACGFAVVHAQHTVGVSAQPLAAAALSPPAPPAPVTAPVVAPAPSAAPSTEPSPRDAGAIPSNPVRPRPPEAKRASSHGDSVPEHSSPPPPAQPAARGLSTAVPF